MLCAVPLLRALREKFPSAYIALMASPVNYDVMLHLRYIDKVIKFDKREFLGRGIKGIGALVQFIRLLRGDHFELAIVPSTVSLSFTSDLLARLSGARVRIGVKRLNGRASMSAFCFNVPVELDWTSTPNRHQVLRNLDVAQPLMLPTPPLHVEITFDNDEVDKVHALKRKKIASGSRVVVYHPGAGKVANRWSARFFAQVADELSQRLGATTLVSEGPMDEVPVSEMLRHLTTPFEVVRGKGIREMAVILAASDLVITNDTGIMHVAAGVGVPVLSLFGPTEPEQWAPLGSQNRFLRGRGGDINAISVEEVLQCAAEMLSNR
jgi:ADP-heptose:LPS heptosyltransferase